MVRPGIRGGMVTKTASPRRTRARLNSNGSVQHQITLFDYIAKAQQAGTIAGAIPDQQPLQGPGVVQHDPGDLAHQPQNPALQEDPGQVGSLADRIREVRIREPTEDLGTAGDRVELNEYLEPCIPGPHQGPVQEDSEGWNLIDKWGVWDCTLCEFPTMQDIPRPYRETWAAAVVKILGAINMADEGIELERGLKWLLIIPKAVFRQSKRGGKAGKGLIAQSVNSLVRGDWGGLLNLMEADCRQAKLEENKVKQKKKGDTKEDVELEKKRKNALLLLSKGQISKAVRRINSYGIGDMRDPGVLQQMEVKYPHRGHPLPSSVFRGQCVDNLRGLRQALLDLNPGVSPGTGGMRPEYLTCLAEVWREDQMNLLEQFGMRYLSGNLPPWWYKVWLSLTTVALYKTSEQKTVRPVGIEPCLARTLHKIVNRQNQQALVKYFEPQQVVVSVAGGAKLVNCVRMLSEANPSFVVVKCDIKNAFNSVSRAQVLKVMDSEEELRHLAWHAALSLASPNALESGGKVWGQAREGATQGDPEAGTYFCAAWHPQIRELDREIAMVGGAARAGMDDLFVVGPAEIIFPALERFWNEVEQICLLKLERSKTEVFTWSDRLPDNTPAGLTVAGCMVEEQFLPGFMCYGIPIGSPEYVKHQLSLKVQEVAKEVEEIVRVLEGEGQAIWTIARSSTATKMDYHLSLCYPSDMVEAAMEIDRILLSMVQKATCLAIPMVDQGMGVEHCPRPPVDRIAEKSYQNWMMRTPVRLGGMGLRSVAETSIAAFVGGIEQSVPHFVGEGGLCTQLAPILGDMSQSTERWTGMLASGCRTGVEFETAWQSLKQEASQSCNYLGKELDGLLAADVQGAGDGSEDGSTRRHITIWMEDTRARVLTKALEQYPDQKARPVWVHPQLDKLSQGWILSLPGHRGFTQAEFSETVARFLCLPSPCCQARIGETLDQHGLLVDPFGDNVMSVSNIPGDMFRIRHDTIKTVINSFCMTSSLRSECEVYGLFRDLIPVEALENEEELERGRGRQGLLPDFRMEIPSPTGEPTQRLAELKIIGAVPTWYPRSGGLARKKKAVERRAAPLPNEYRTPLAKLDAKYHGTQPGQVGPLVRRLQGYGQLLCLVMGQFQEGSKDLHLLLESLAAARLRSIGLARGREGSDQERSLIMQQLRRELSTAGAKANSACLIGRVSRIGEGHRLAAKRRMWVRREEEIREEASKAHWLANIRGRGIIRGVGEFIY